MLFFMNESVDTLLQKMGRIAKTGEIVDFHRQVTVALYKKGEICRAK